MSLTRLHMLDGQDFTVEINIEGLKWKVEEDSQEWLTLSLPGLHSARTINKHAISWFEPVIDMQETAIKDWLSFGRYEGGHSDMPIMCKAIHQDFLKHCADRKLKVPNLYTKQSEFDLALERYGFHKSQRGGIDVWLDLKRRF